MAKGKKWALRFFGAAALALLICLCLLGSTMARYASTGEGGGALTVALWDLEVENALTGNETVSLSTAISPSMEQYDSNKARDNDSKPVKVLEIQNNSAVAAKVVVSRPIDADTGNDVVDLGWADNFEWGVGWTTDNGTNKYGAELMAKFGEDFTEDDFASLVTAWGVFYLYLSSETSDAGGGATSLTINLTGKDDFWPSDHVSVMITWTSICEADAEKKGNLTKPDGFTSWEEFSDAVDTILCMYVTTLSFDLAWTAVQASVQPDPNAVSP